MGEKPRRLKFINTFYIAASIARCKNPSHLQSNKIFFQMRHNYRVFLSTYKKDKTLPTKRTLKTSVSKREKSILTEEWLVAVWKLHSQRLLKRSKITMMMSVNQPYMEVHRTKDKLSRTKCERKLLSVSVLLLHSSVQ